MKHLLPVAIFTLLFFSAFTSKAQTAFPRFQKHYVLEGETATSIARNFNVSLQDFCLLNDFPQTVKLKPGQQVLIKQLKNDEEEVMEEVPMPTRRDPVKTVAKEDAIVSYDEPAPAKPARETAPAKRSNLPAEEAAVPAPSTKAVEVGPHGTKYKVSQEEYHIVQKNQTFYRIALIYGLTVDELKELNNLSSTTIEIGQRLKVRK